MLNFNPDLPYLFISYKSDDREVIVRNVDHLQNVYGLNLWFDEDLTAGRNWDDEAAPILVDPNCQAVLFFASELALMSPNVQKELEFADLYQKPIIPINFSPDSFHEVVTGSITRKYRTSNWKGVLNALTILREYLPQEKTYLYLHRDSYYPELIKAISRIAPGVQISESKKPAPAAKAQSTTPAAPVAEPVPVAPTPVEPAPIASTPAEPAPDAVSLPESTPVIIRRGFQGNAVTYTLYGSTSTQIWHVMMLDVFGQVFSRHPEIADAVLDTLLCASPIDYEDPTNRTDQMPAYFRNCHTFMVGGKLVCIGTNFNAATKLTYLARLLQLAGEDPSVLTIEGHKLPAVTAKSSSRKAAAETKKSAAKGKKTAVKGKSKEKKPATVGSGHSSTGDLSFTLYGQSYTQNQSEMMFTVFGTVFDRHPESVSRIVAAMACVDEVDYTLPANQTADMSSVYRACRTYTMPDGQLACVGASLNFDTKLRYLAKLLQLVEEDPSVLQIEGYPLPSVGNKRGRPPKKSQ